jgi:hypothetical protein
LESLAEPPAPVQVSTNIVVAERAPLVALPLVAFVPDQPPDAVQVVAFVLAHDNAAVAPLATLAGDALRLTVGAATTVTVFESLPEPAGPVQVSVKVVVADSALLVAVPSVVCVPDQPPDAVHDVELVLVQVSCVVPPLGTLAGLTVRLTLAAESTATALVSLAAPPAPVQVSVKLVFTESVVLVALPLVALAPAQPPDAVHEVALVLLHVSCVVPPIGTALGLTCSDTVGVGVDVVWVVALAGADGVDSLRFGLMRSNAVTV